jgi:hypothetical protein
MQLAAPGSACKRLAASPYRAIDRRKRTLQRSAGAVRPPQSIGDVSREQYIHSYVIATDYLRAPSLAEV